ncbi:MAG: hypothetical protein WC648_05025 [Candidatus Paceibacterota bacterium]|jgi:hypothetical protein
MTTSPIFRIVLNLLLGFCVIMGWWYFAIIIIVIGSISWAYYWEMILAGIVYDALFGMVPEMGVWGYIGTIVSIVLFLIISLLHSMLRKV